FDPYLFGRELGDLVRKHGGSFYDLTGDFARQPHLDRDFYIVNGHPTGEGAAIIADRVSALLSRQAPAFQACEAAP
ncbi:MAG: hypothetical protein JSS35_08650, partial [Proteobacteria bacterium]|nr:hypothetical protein [Pseudomonadota bacterium]